LNVIHRFGTTEWQDNVKEFRRQQPNLIEIYRRTWGRTLIPLTLPDGRVLDLSPGEHNELQAAIVKEFAPRFAPGAYLLYLGDTANKMLHVETERLSTLGVPVTQHDKLPDVVLYEQQREWLFLIEAVTSHGPMSDTRVQQLILMLANCTAESIFVSAFPDLKTFKKYISEIAWETEVWIAENPDHLIHFNGDKFLGPRDP